MRLLNRSFVCLDVNVLFFVIFFYFSKKNRDRYKYRKKSYDIHIQFYLEKRHLIYKTNIFFNICERS